MVSWDHCRGQSKDSTKLESLSVGNGFGMGGRTRSCRHLFTGEYLGSVCVLIVQTEAYLPGVQMSTSGF